jgi:hypothetical protein
VYLILSWFKGKSRPTAKWNSELKVLGVFSIVYLVTWGFFFGHHIAHRFVGGVPAVGFFLVLLLISRFELPAVLASIALAMPAVWGGEMEVSALKIAAAFDENLVSYHKKIGKGPASLTEDLQIILQHKKKNLGEGAQYNQGAIFSDSVWNYYGPSVFYHAEAPVTSTLISQTGIDVENGCAKKFILERDIRYFWLKEQDTWNEWPSSIKKLLNNAEEIKVPHGRLWYLKDPGAVLNCPPNMG